MQIITKHDIKIGLIILIVYYFIIPRAVPADMLHYVHIMLGFAVIVWSAYYLFMPIKTAEGMQSNNQLKYSKMLSAFFLPIGIFVVFQGIITITDAFTSSLIDVLRKITLPISVISLAIVVIFYKIISSK